MEMHDKDFEFALEMIILKRNENGATLSEIRDDFEAYFHMNIDSVLGYKYAEQYMKPMLENVMQNISFQTVNGGCVLYYMNIDAAISKLSDDLSEIMEYVCTELNIDLNKLIEMRDANLMLQSRSTNNSRSDSSRNTQPKSTSTSTVSTPDCEFYGHFLIGDNLFLEMAHIDLQYKKFTKSKIKQIGHCVSGQNIKKAVRNIARVIDQIPHRGAIINLGSVDLLQGRELVDMMVDMTDLCKMLCAKNIFPIVTTIPPLANQMHNEYVEQKRKIFNQLLVRDFDCIDIEWCFLSSFGRILFECYEEYARRVGGTSCPIVHWNHVGRQRVVKMLKRKIPEIYEFC